MPARLYRCEAILEPLAEDFEDVPLEFGQLIEEEHPMVGQGHLAWHRDVPAAD